MTYFLSIKTYMLGPFFSQWQKIMASTIMVCLCLLRLKDQLLPSKHDPFPMGISLNNPVSITVSLHWIHNISFIPKGRVDVLIHQTGNNETAE